MTDVNTAVNILTSVPPIIVKAWDYLIIQLRMCTNDIERPHKKKWSHQTAFVLIHNWVCNHWNIASLLLDCTTCWKINGYATSGSSHVPVFKKKKLSPSTPAVVGTLLEQIDHFENSQMPQMSPIGTAGMGIAEDAAVQ